MPIDKNILRDYVATANSGRYNTIEEVNAKFPELKGYDTKLLKDYLATVNSGKYSSLDEVNSKFPEFFEPEKKKPSTSDASIFAPPISQGTGQSVKLPPTPTSSTASPSASKPQKSTTPSVSTGEGKKVSVPPITDKPIQLKQRPKTGVSDFVTPQEFEQQIKDKPTSANDKFIEDVNTNVLEIVKRDLDTFVYQKDMPTMYGTKKIPAGTPNVENIAKAVDLYAEKVKKETGQDISNTDKQYIINSTIESLKVRNQTQKAAMLTDLQFQQEKKVPLVAITGVKNEKGEILKQSMFQEGISKTLAEEQSRLNQIAKTPNKEISAEFAPELQSLNAEVKTSADILNKEMQDYFNSNFSQQQQQLYDKYNGLVQSGQMTEDMANEELKQKLQAIQEEIKLDTNDVFAPKLNQLKQEAESKVKEIQTRYNRKVEAQFELEKQKSAKRIEAQILEYENALPEGYMKEYQAAFQKNLDNEMNLEGLKKISEFSNLGNFEKMQTALMAGWGDVASTIGGALSYAGVNTGNLQNWVAQSGLYNELPVFNDDNVFDNLTNTDWWIANGVRSIPFTLATMPVGIFGGATAGVLARALGATKRAQMISSVVGGGLVGWEVERFLEQGAGFNDAINEGKSLEEAAEIAAAIGKYNYSTLPMNMLQMLPVFNKSFKFLGTAGIEAGAGAFEEINQGWAQAKAKAKSEGQDVSYLEYATSPQAIQEGAIGAAMSQGFTLLSLKNTPDIDKHINTLMTSIGMGGEAQALEVLKTMRNNGAIDDKQFQEAKNLLNYTLTAISQTENINIDDSVKSSLVNRFVAIEKAKELLTENENDLASQAAKELIAEKQEEIKSILKGSEPVYLIRVTGNEVPVVSTKEQIDALLSNPASLPLFEIEVYNDIKTQASVEEAYSKQAKESAQTEEGGEIESEPEQAQVEEVNVSEDSGKLSQLESLVNQVPVEDLRRPNGSIGTQGFTAENLVDLARFISTEMGFDIPAFDSSLGTSEIRQVIDYLRGNKEAQQKIKEYVIKDPVVVSQMPDGSYSIADGNHRANLLNLIGVEVIPTIELNGRTNQEAIEEHKKAVEEIIKPKQDAVQEQAAGQVPVQSEAKVSEEVEGGKPKAEPKEATEEKQEEVAKKAGISPKNLRDLYNVNRKLFGLDRVKSLASAVAMDRMIGAMAKRAGTTKAEMYGKLKFEKASEEFVKGLSDKAKVLWQIVGENAQLAQDVRDNLQVARSMESEGKDAKTIRLSTGWERGKDGKWRYELDKTNINYNILPILKAYNEGFYYVSASNDYVLDDQSGNKGVKVEDSSVSYPLEQIIGANSELLKLYPQLSKIKVVYTNKLFNDNAGGEWDSNSRTIRINTDNTISNEEVSSVLLHEIQHAIQDIEGFAKGGSLKQMSTPNDVLQTLASPFNFPKLNKDERAEAKQKTKEKGLRFSENFYFDVISDDPNVIEDAIDRLEILNEIYPNESYVKLIEALDYKLMETRGVNVAFEKYKRLAGEVESRNVQTRMGMTIEQRRQTLLSETEDVARDEQIVLFQKADDKARGAVMVSMDGQAVIYALTDPNVSTPLHELAHVFEHYLTDAEKNSVMKAAGTKEWNIQTSEFFARGFEKYLAEGKSPVPALDKLFAKFKEWLTEIYNGIKGSDIDIKLNKKMRDIYSQMLGVEISEGKSKKEQVDEVKVEKSKKAFEALLKEESASPTAKKKASELKKEAGDKAVKEAAEIMENIDSIRQQLLDAGVIKSINCKWGK